MLRSKADLTTKQNKINMQRIIEVCTQERKNTKWRFKLITNVTIFVTLSKNVPMAVSFLIKDVHTQQPRRDTLCLFRALV